MTLYWVPGKGYVSDQDEDIPFYGSLPFPDGTEITWGDKGVREVPTYTLQYQFPSEEGRPSSFQWEPGAPIPPMVLTPPGYLQTLLQMADQAEAGQLKDYEREQYEQMRAQALSVPTRDLSRLTSAATGGYWRGGPEDPQEAAWWLSQGSPDLGAIMLGLRDKLRAGTATDAERTLFEEVRHADAYQHWVASTPQPSDAFNPLSNEFFIALNALSGAVGGAASFGAFGAAGAAGAGAGAAGGSVLGIPTSTLATLGTVGGYGAQGAGMLGTALQQPWLTRLAGALGAASGLAGGVAGLGNLAASGVQNVSDVGRLLQSTGRVTGALGAIPGADPLRQAGRYLGLAGQVGRAGGGAGELFQAAQDVQQGATGGGRMSEWDWTDWGGGDFPGDYSTDVGPGDWYSGVSSMPTWGTGDFPGDLSSLQDQLNEMMRTHPELYGSDVSQGAGGGAGWLSSVLGSLGQVGSFIGSNAGWLGPAVSGLAGLGAGALGSQAARDAAGVQSDALNRALELQTAQWLQTQANEAPWLEAGRQALPQLQQLAGQGAPTPFVPRPAISGAGYALPGVTPTWNPTPYQGPAPVQAGDYRYTPGQAPSAAAYRYTPGAVPTLSGQELLAHDPGVAFRQSQAREALEASAAARGGLLSGPTLAALQRQSQDLASQEYGAAWNRASQQAQLREQWNQIASQQGWTQAEAETRLREQMAQVASQQGWQQALQGQQTAWEQGLKGQEWWTRQQQAYDQDLYTRQMEQSKLRYGQDWAQDVADYERLVAAYNSQQGAQTTQWNRLAALAQLGPVATNQLASGGQNNANAMGNLLTALGQTQAGGVTGPANSWINALTNVSGSVLGGLQNQQFQQQLATLLGSLNR
jgi:hypothetical protein